jgi:hypothetical protein
VRIGGEQTGDRRSLIVDVSSFFLQYLTFSILSDVLGTSINDSGSYFIHVPLEVRVRWN